MEDVGSMATGTPVAFKGTPADVTGTLVTVAGTPVAVAEESEEEENDDVECSNGLR